MNLLKSKLSRTVATAAALSVIGCATAAYAANDFTGNWQTTGGNFASAGTMVKIWGGAANASGSYTWRDGHMTGRMDNTRFDGIWTQSASGRACGQARGGTRYWGHFSIQMTGNGHFAGRWSYCDEAAGSAGDWSARRV